MVPGWRVVSKNMSEKLNNAADWEGADDLEQELQNKIKKNMEQEPKIEKTREELIKEITDILEGMKYTVDWLHDAYGKENRSGDIAEYRRILRSDLDDLKNKVESLK